MIMRCLQAIAIAIDLILAWHYSRKQNVCAVILYCTLASIIAQI